MAIDFDRSAPRSYIPPYALMKNFMHGRPLIQDSMPPLAEACADFKDFAPGDPRTDRVFGVLLNTAAMVYRRLDREGLLTRVRGSQTMMAARVLRPRFAVRGVVCMPIWLP